MKPVRVYTSSFCYYCVQAKRLLKRKGVPFEEIDVSSDHTARAWLVEESGQRTVPQIFIGDVSVGGFSELSGLERAGKLDAMLVDD